MDFSLTEDQLMLQKMVADFTRQEIEPRAMKIDAEGRVPDDLLKKMADIGLLGMTVPRRHGGTEAGNLACVLACEQVAYSGTGAWWLVGFNNSIPESIDRFGSRLLKEKYLKKMCDGSTCSSIQFTEEKTGSDPEALETTAVPDGDNYVINGMKRFSTFGARDGLAVIYTKDETGRCTAFVLEKNTRGYSAPKIWDLMGGGGIEAADVYLENVRVPRENLLGKKGEGFIVLQFWIATEKIEQCGACVGIAQAALDEAIKYAKARTSRDKPISNMQGIRWMLGDMHARLQAARWLTYRAAFLQDRESPDWQIEAAAAKLFVIPAAAEIVQCALSVHGGYGYTKEFKIERLYRAVAGASSIATGLEINRSIVGSAMVR